MNLKNRLKKIEQRVKGALYTTNVTQIYYLTGLTLSRGTLLIQKKGSTLFVDSRYTEYVRKKSSIQMAPLSLEEVKKKINVKPLYFDPNECTYNEGEEVIKKLHAQPLQGLNPITLARAQKDQSEVRCIRKSCLLLKKAYDHIRKKVKEGITEKELAVAFELFAKKHGAERLSFEPIIAFGINSAMPHHRSGNTKLKKNSVILMDLGLIVNGYASDMTRSFFYGTVSEKIQTLYTAVTKAQEASRNALRVGAHLRSIDQAARDVFKEYGVEDLYLHALGHGVGLDVHEYPIISVQRSIKDAKLLENMVVAIEPGLYLPGVGGIRLEEMFFITKEGPKKLTV